ncbi:MAG: ComEC/Rec2 family competence protein [Chitinophagaceae bacterium]|nr:ComEC/Rec2 family competence protein [Chitinophagaceae bacterium]
MVYWLLATLLNPIANYTKMKWIKPLGVIAGLWLFSLLAGASPSVLRSAVMFSFLVVGELFGKRTNAINNLAASAFLLLCFNPSGYGMQVFNYHMQLYLVY